MSENMSKTMHGIKPETLFKNIQLISIFALGTFFAQRVFILFWSLQSVPWSFSQTVQSLILGTLFDISFILYALIPYVLLFLIYPRFQSANTSKRFFWILLDVLNFVFVFMVLYIAISELFFWDEFKARYNFIAVDYLIYTTEVLKNIIESYPTWKILTALFVIDILVLLQINKRLEIKVSTEKNGIQKLKFLAASLVVFAFNFFVMNQEYSHSIKSIPYQEISKNGGYSLFYSYFENQINYDQFYIHMPIDKAIANVRKSLATDNSVVFPKNESLKRRVTYPAGLPEQTNVVVVLMESMGARFLGAFGSKENLTPNLDFFAAHGLFFNNMYATGTRTVRGIEALTLSVPPTPGQSIVRRPDNENLVTLNSYFKQANYDVQFVYGGYSYFDNMKYYFENNNARVLDISDVPKDQIQFSNAWGMSDEDLFKFAIKNADQDFAENKPFFQIILTTSNHRPFTYPEGKIDIPSGSGRNGAVKYADYSIGQFIDQARDKKWFDNTIFLFLADHDAGVAGNTEVNKNDYLIPAIFFAPKIIKPEIVSNMGSQVDVGPTLLGLLKMSHDSFGFGLDLKRSNPGRAFISNYQKVGLLKENFLTLIEPVRQSVQYKVSDSGYTKDTGNAKELDETVSYYQIASYLYKKHQLKRDNESLVFKH